MRNWAKILVVLAMAMGVLPVQSRAASGGAEAFEKLKALVGHWESTGPGEKSTLDIELTAGGSAIVERVDGDYFNVVGLPVAALVEALRAFGAPPFAWLTGPRGRR